MDSMRGNKALLNAQAMADEQSTSGKSHFSIIIRDSKLNHEQMPARVTSFNIVDAILDNLQPIYSAASSLSLYFVFHSVSFPTILFAKIVATVCTRQLEDLLLMHFQLVTEGKENLWTYLTVKILAECSSKL